MDFKAHVKMLPELDIKDEKARAVLENLEAGAGALEYTVATGGHGGVGFVIHGMEDGSGYSWWASKFYGRGETLDTAILNMHDNILKCLVEQERQAFKAITGKFPEVWFRLYELDRGTYENERLGRAVSLVRSGEDSYSVSVKPESKVAVTHSDIAEERLKESRQTVERLEKEIQPLQRQLYDAQQDIRRLEALANVAYVAR